MLLLSSLVESGPSQFDPHKEFSRPSLFPLKHLILFLIMDRTINGCRSSGELILLVLVQYFLFLFFLSLLLLRNGTSPLLSSEVPVFFIFFSPLSRLSRRVTRHLKVKGKASFFLLVFRRYFPFSTSALSCRCSSFFSESGKLFGL